MEARQFNPSLVGQPLSNHHIDPLIRKLGVASALPNDDVELLRSVRITVRNLAPGEDLVRAGQVSHISALVLSGMVCRYNMLGTGTRQIMSFHISGDIPDLQSLFIERMDHTVAAIGSATMGLMPHEDLERVFRKSFNLASLMWRETLIDAAIFRQWIANIGGRPALAAMAHLFCEMITRAKAVGLVNGGNSYRLTLTQQDIGDALGLSIVHVNRTIRKLRELGCIAWEPGLLTVLDWDALSEAGDFDPSYLHMKGS
jgi:CRP-like cAMP-binding protein